MCNAVAVGEGIVDFHKILLRISVVDKGMGRLNKVFVSAIDGSITRLTNFTIPKVDD